MISASGDSIVLLVRVICPVMALRMLQCCTTAEWLKNSSGVQARASRSRS